MNKEKGRIVPPARMIARAELATSRKGPWAERRMKEMVAEPSSDSTEGSRCRADDDKDDDDVDIALPVAVADDNDVMVDDDDCDVTVAADNDMLYDECGGGLITMRPSSSGLPREAAKVRHARTAATRFAFNDCCWYC